MSHRRIISQTGSLTLRSCGNRSPLPQPSNAAAATTQLLRQGQPANLYHGTGAARLPYKDDQDRESLKPKAQEYSKSDLGGDDAAAHRDEAAFDRHKTSPEQEKDAAADGSNPLEASPANKDISAVKEQENNTSGQQKQKRSGGGGHKG